MNLDSTRAAGRTGLTERLSTTLRRRRAYSRRGAAAIAAGTALLLLSGVLSPVQAAAPFVDSERISGPTRYETAAEIAEEYLEEQGGARSLTDTVILASGADADFGYALVAPALARRFSAPLLLTDPNQLSAAAARFIDNNSIDRVFILGDTSVVSSAVQASVDRISGVAVTRLGSGDVYATAAQVAERVGPSVGSPGRFGSHGRTSLLATGEVFADALAAGPLAYRGEHPILLTPRTSLHPDVSRFLSRSNTEHVIILGGPAAVSGAVESAIRDLGITVSRLYGADRFATSVRIGEELLGDSSPQGCFDGGELGLASGLKAPDAIASGPLLGELCAPLVLTDSEELPKSVEDFLESSDYVTGDLDGELDITVFGGTSAVRRAVIIEVVNAATLDPISARIRAVEGRCHFTVDFDDPVRTADVEDIGNFILDDRTLEPGDASADAGNAAATTSVTVVLRGAVAASPGGVPVGCVAPLIAGDLLELRGGRIGTTTDRRTVRRAAIAVAADRSRPRLTISALDGADIVYIESSEAIEDTDQGRARVRFKRSGQDAEFSDLHLGDGEFRHEVDVPFADGLQPGDVVTVDAGEVQDLAGNTNSEVSTTARRDQVAPRVARVTVSAPAGRSAASIGIDGRLATRISDAMEITAKATGSAYGAIGNDWRLDIELVEDGDAELPATVDVSTASQQIDIRVAEDRTLDEIVDDLNSDSVFRQHFSARISGSTSSAHATLNDRVNAGRLQGGVSTVDLTVYWSEPVRDCDAAEGQVKPGLLELDVEGDGKYDFFLDGLFSSRLAVTFVDAPDGNPAITADAAACDNAVGVAPGTLVARLESERLASLPALTSRLLVRKGAATDLKGNESVHRRFSGFTRP